MKILLTFFLFVLSASAQEIIRVPAGPARIRSIAATATALYGLGQDEELYRFEPGGWKQEPSIANLQLWKIGAALDGTLYGIGQQGLHRNSDGKNWVLIHDTNSLSRGGLYVHPGNEYVLVAIRHEGSYQIMAPVPASTWALNLRTHSRFRNFAMLTPDRLLPEIGASSDDESNPTRAAVVTQAGKAYVLRDRLYEYNGDYSKLQPVAGADRIQGCDLSLGLYNRLYVLECAR